MTRKLDVILGFIKGHVGDVLTVSGRMPDLKVALDDLEALAVVEVAPGCDMRRDRWKVKFSILLNCGGFPDIPGVIRSAEPASSEVRNL